MPPAQQPHSAGGGGGQGQPPGQAQPPAASQVLEPWRRLRADTAVAREHRATCWRVLHGALLVGALRLHTDASLPAAAGCCGLAECGGGGGVGAAQLETLTHALLECPAAAPVVDWALRLWAVLTPGQPQPPRCPLLLLADYRAAWQPAADSATVWAALRVTMLGCIWHARCSRRSWDVATARVCAFRAAAAVVDFLREAIWRDWRRASSDVRLGSEDVCSSWFRGRQHALPKHVFLRRWSLGGRLCSVQPDGSLRVHLSWYSPVCVPGPGPGVPEDGGGSPPPAVCLGGGGGLVGCGFVGQGGGWGARA